MVKAATLPTATELNVTLNDIYKLFREC